MAEVEAFLSHLATTRHVSASTQNQALSALVFLYAEVLGASLGPLQRIARARRPSRLPVVLTPSEVAAIIRHLNGPCWLMASLLYGSGLRLFECCNLRIKDIDFHSAEIRVRDGKGRRDRVTMLPEMLRAPLTRHLARVKNQHQSDTQDGTGSVALPDALRRKYPRAPWEWGWQLGVPGNPLLHRP